MSDSPVYLSVWRTFNSVSDVVIGLLAIVLNKPYARLIVRHQQRHFGTQGLQSVVSVRILSVAIGMIFGSRALAAPGQRIVTTSMPRSRLGSSPWLSRLLPLTPQFTAGGARLRLSPWCSQPTS